jgi:hypothetical protein
MWRVVLACGPVGRRVGATVGPLTFVRPVSTGPLPLEEDVTHAYNERAKAEDARLRAAYDAPIRPGAAAAAGLGAEEAYRKRLLYRSKQRGWCVCGGGG